MFDYPVNHTVHILMSIITGGLWLPVYLWLVWQEDQATKNKRAVDYYLVHGTLPPK